MIHLMVITLVTQLTSVWLDRPPKPVINKLAVVQVEGFGMRDGREHAILSIDYSLNFEIFDWNTKQVYLFVQADYATSQMRTNQIILFDYVISSGATLNGTNVLCEYPLEDFNRGLKENHVTLSLGWDVMPYIGLVGKLSHLQTIGEYSLKMPGDYVPLKRTRSFIGPQAGKRGDSL